LILKNYHHLKEFEDWGHCCVVKGNVNENISVPLQVLCHVYNYTWFVKCSSKAYEVYLKQKMEKKKNVNI
jgi:hypothetical protein